MRDLKLRRKNPQNIKSATSKYIQSLFLEKVAFDLDHQPTNAEFIDHINHHLFMVTAHIKYTSAKTTINKQNYAMAAFKTYYLELVKCLVQSRPRRNTSFQPLVYICYDVEGSRHNSPALDEQIPHFHGLILLHPRTRTNFLEALHDGKLNTSQDGRVEDVKYESPRGTEGDLKHIVNYVIKHSSTLNGVDTNYAPDAVFPDLRNSRYPFFLRPDTIVPHLDQPQRIMPPGRLEKAEKPSPPVQYIDAKAIVEAETAKLAKKNEKLQKQRLDRDATETLNQLPKKTRKHKVTSQPR